MGYYKYAMSVALIAGTSASVSAFTLNTTADRLLGWEASPLPIDYNFSECPADNKQSLISLLDRALEVWNGVPTSSLRLVRGNEVSTSAAVAATASAPSTPLVICDSNFSQRVSAEEADVVPGLTLNVRVDSSTARIVFGVVLLNSQAGSRANVATTEPERLMIVLAHEIGHLIGIGHSEDQASLMYFNLTEKKSAGLSMDDLDAISYLYPRSEPFGSGALGCGSTRTPGGRMGGGTILEVLLLGAMLLGWRGFRHVRGV